MNIPEWVDRRTAEWAAEVCEHVSAEFLIKAALNKHAQGASTCAKTLRAAMSSERPQLPAVVLA